MLKLGIVQFFSWFAFFTMWSMATPALTEHVFDAAKPDSNAFNMDDSISATAYKTADLAYNNAADLVGSAMGSYGLSSMVFALILTFLASKININRKWVHLFSLIIGGIGFLLMTITKDQSMLHLCFIAIGFSWGSILSMPYAMLSSAIDPTKMGLYMGLFNMFIVIPQILAAVGLTFIYTNLIGEAPINAMVLAGMCLIIAGLSNLLITNPKAIKYHGE
jgi:maltose/moltooligosaccharide transporter